MGAEAGGIWEQGTWTREYGIGHICLSHTPCSGRELGRAQGCLSTLPLNSRKTWGGAGVRGEQTLSLGQRA